MPLSIETVAPIWTTMAVCLMVAFAVHAFEDVWTWLAFLGGRTILSRSLTVDSILFSLFLEFYFSFSFLLIFYF